MRRRLLVLATATVLPAAWMLLRPGQSSSARDRSSSAPVLAGNAGITTGGRVHRNHYRLTFEQFAAVPGHAVTSVLTQGTWTTTPRADGRLEVRFAPEATDAPPADAPTAAELASPVQLVTDRGVITAMGFADEMPDRARRLMTGLATTFQMSDRAGASWTVAEEDLTGAYTATYRRTGTEAHRQRTTYTALRGQGGLSRVERDAPVTATEQSVFRVDEHGIVTAAIELEVKLTIGQGVPPITLELRGSLERESVDLVPAATGPQFSVAPISDHVDYGVAIRNADESTVAGASAADMLAEVRRVFALGDATGAANDRAQVLARMAALVRVDPDAAEELADAVREYPDHLAEAELIAGALASTRVAAGTDALAGLVDSELPDATRRVAVGVLGLSDPPTPHGLRALTNELDRANGDAAAYGLGTLGRKSITSNPDGAQSAVDELIARYRRAGNDEERQRYLEALGNTGSPRALAVLVPATSARDQDFASAATFSLRFIPGEDVDALLDQLLTRPEVAFAAVRAVGFREPARWRTALLATRGRFPDHNGIQNQIDAIFRLWS